MKIIQYEKHTLNIPESWAEVPFKNFVKASKIGETTFLINASLIGIPANTLRNSFPLSVLNEINTIMAFTQSPPECEPIFDFISNDKKYTLVHSLAKMSFGQFIDIDGKTFDKDSLDRITTVMAILFFQEGESDYEQVIPHISERAIEFGNLPCSIVLGIGDFFFLLSILLSVDSQKYLISQKQTLLDLKKEVTSYLNPIDGQALPINSSITTYLTSTLSRIDLYLKSFTT